jgi:hypothetical protein
VRTDPALLSDTGTFSDATVYVKQELIRAAPEPGSRPQRRTIVTRVALLVLLAFAGCGGGGGGSEAAPADRAAAGCQAARVNHAPYPGGDERLHGIPWVRGEPRALDLVGLLWYWNEDRWGKSQRARIFTGGTAPEGYNAKVMWAFLAPSARDRGGGELVIEGRNLDGPGKFRDTFAAIGYEGQEGAPSYASIIDLPSPGCWRLTLKTGDLKAQVDLRAVRLPPRRPSSAGR